MSPDLHADLPKPLATWFGRDLTATQSAAAGAVLGALVGDAAGGTLEFIGRKPTDREARRALLEMPGGGVFGLAPGQFTDDGELTTALLGALQDSEGKWEEDQVAFAYCRWSSSQPFDMGNATSAALGRRKPEKALGLAALVRARACDANAESKANGALMRISPLAVAGVSWTESELAEAARNDARLTHPNVTCQHANAAYVLALRHLFLHPGEARGAFDVADRYLGVQGAAGEVHGWLRDAAAGQLAPVHPMAGFVRHGFTRAFHHLIRESAFDLGVTEVLAEGGDTDTNACIVGAMLGALHGVHRLPLEALVPVLHCDCKAGQERPPAFLIGAVRDSLLPLLERL